MEYNEERFSVRLRGLPWSASDKEIMQFIDCDIIGGESGIRRSLTRDGKPSGEAYVELYSQDDVNKCLAKDREKIGTRYIEVFQSTIKEMEYAINSGDEEAESAQDSFKGGVNIVRLRGVPYHCTKEEIAQFFSGLEIMPNGVSLPLDDSGRSTGEAFVEFATPQGAEGALEKHKEKIGHRYIEVFKSNMRELNHSCGEYEYKRSIPARGRPGPYDRPRGPRAMRGGRYGGPPRGGSGRGYGRYGSGYGGGDFYDDYEEEDYGWNDNGGYGNAPPRRGRGGMMKGYRGRGFGGGANDGYGSRNYNNGGRFDEDDDFGDGNGVGGQHTVHLRGLPFKATDDDIANFFSPVVPTRIHREYGNDGRMSGEANAEFASRQDAQAAMKKNGESMAHRYIELFLRTGGGQQRGGMRGRRRGSGRPRGGYRF